MINTVEQAKALVAKMSRGEKAQLLQHIARDLGDAYPGIDLTAGVSGGEPCIAGHGESQFGPSRQARRSGAGEAELLRIYSGLRADDLANAWAFVRAHRDKNRSADSGQRSRLITA